MSQVAVLPHQTNGSSAGPASAAAWLAAAADDDLWHVAAERNMFPLESADRLYGWTATPGPRGAAGYPRV